MDKYTANVTNDYRVKGQSGQTAARPAAPSAPLQRQTASGPEGLAQTAPQSMTPTTMESTYYLAGLLTTFIGSKVRVQFLIGTTGPLLDIVGTLIQVGANYIIIQPIETDDLMICDLFSIKFTTVYR